MSHLSRISTKFKSFKTLQETLKAMNCEVLVGDNLRTQRGFEDTEVDALINPDGMSHKDIMGVKWSGDELELVGDDYGVRRNDQRFSMSEFSKDVTRQYARNEIVNQFGQDADLADFSLVNETVNENGETVLLFENWA